MGIDAVDRVLDDSNFRFSSIPGWCSLEKAKRMARFVVESAAPAHAPTRSVTPRDVTAGVLCVELGVFGGRGVVAFGLAVKHCLGSRGLVHGIDPYTAGAALEGTNDPANVQWWSRVSYEDIRTSAHAAVAQFGLSDVVRLIRERSLDVVDDYAPGVIDILHQDANHSEETSCAEVDAWTPKMRPGGVWIFDDTDWPTTKRAQKKLVEEKGYALIEDHLTWAAFRAP